MLWLWLVLDVGVDFSLWSLCCSNSHLDRIMTLHYKPKMGDSVIHPSYRFCNPFADLRRRGTQVPWPRLDNTRWQAQEMRRQWRQPKTLWWPCCEMKITAFRSVEKRFWGHTFYHCHRNDFLTARISKVLDDLKQDMHNASNEELSSWRNLIQLDHPILFSDRRYTLYAIYEKQFKTRVETRGERENRYWTRDSQISLMDHYPR